MTQLDSGRSYENHRTYQLLILTINDGMVIRRHIDQLRARSSSLPTTITNQQDTQQLHHSNIYISCESRDFLAFHTQTISRCSGNFRTHRVRVCPITEEYSGTLSAREKHQFILRFLFPRLLRHDRTRRSRCPSSITPSPDADPVSSRTDR